MHFGQLMMEFQMTSWELVKLVVQMPWLELPVIGSRCKAWAVGRVGV